VFAERASDIIRTVGRSLRYWLAQCANRAVPNWAAWVVLPLVAVLGVSAFVVLNTYWCLTIFVFLLGVVPNFLHQWICNWHKNRLRGAKTFFANHDLTRGVGQAIRLILLDAADPRPDDRLPRVNSENARAWLAAHAHLAANKWPIVVTSESGKSDSKFAALFESQLWRFVERWDTKPLEERAWIVFLRLLNDGNTLPFESDTAAVSAIVHRLNARFGEALWEFTKNAFANSDEAAEALHLLVASELLKRTSEMAEGIASLKSGLAALQAEWTAHRQSVEAKLQSISSKQDWTNHMLRGQLAILTRIEKLLYDKFAPKLAPPPDRRAAASTASAHQGTADQPDPDRFKARREYLAVVGREAELKELADWLAKPDPFLWDLWTGPAGSGKTRLALQLCREHPNWNGGFYQWTSDNTPDWTLWTPHSDTLVIFDYVAEKAKEIGDAIASLHARLAPASEHPLPPVIKVRVLLLERAAVRDAEAAPEAEPAREGANPKGESLAPPQQKLEAPWLGVLRGAATRITADVQYTYARGDLTSPGRYLGGVNPEAAAEIIKAEAASAGETRPIWDVLTSLNAAQAIDPHLRPLFVAMTAEALRERSNIADYTALVAHINEKEWTHACERLRAYKDGPGPDMANWARLVCLATMCGGLKNKQAGGTHDHLAGAFARSAALDLPSKGEYGNGSRYDLLVSGARMHFAPNLEPDVLGEAFAMWWLTSQEPSPRAIIDAAWSLGMTDFVRRAAENFPSNVESLGLLEPVGVADPASLAAAHSAIAAQEWNRGDVATVRNRGQRLVTARVATSDAFLHPPRVRALGVFMWMHGTATAAELEELDACMPSLIEAAKSDPAASADLAKGLNNAIAHAGADHARADGLLARMQALADAHPAEAAVREDLAKGIFNAFISSPANSTRADALLARLQGLADAHPTDPAVREVLARGLFNAFDGSPANSTRADALLVRLQALADAHPPEAAVREDLAKGLFNAFNRSPASSPRADGLLARLQALADAHPADAAVREGLARGLNNAIFHAGADPARTDGLLARLQALADAHPADAAVRERLAKGLNNAIFHAGADPARADRLLARLLTLADANPADPAVQSFALRGCAAAFANSMVHPPLAIHALDRAADVIPRVPTDDETRNIAVAILGLAAQSAKAASGPDCAELERARAALEAAYRARFPAAP